MADSSVAITAGSGTNVDTRTESTNSNHRQVIVIGDPATNAGVAPVDATNGLAVDVKASALPSGAATAANQTTIIGHVDGIEGLLTTMDADTGGILTAVQLIDNAIAGNEMQVDVVASLPAGTNNIGDVDVLSVVPGTGATNLGKAEDAAHTSGDTGVMALAVRSNAGAATSGTDGDYEALHTDAFGLLHVRESLDHYETVAASQTAQTLGATGATGDILSGIWVVPATTSPGNVIILDNATSITVFTGGASSVTTLHGFLIPLGIKSVSGAWKITTGANVSVIAMGRFT